LAERGFVRRWLRRLLLGGIALGVLGVAVLAGLYGWFVVAHPGEHLERDAILRTISQESPVYYRDGQTKLGVFFAEEHRQYLPYAEIPPHFVAALVAAEDQDFWNHFGFSVRGISRAMVSNVKAGRVVAGGSTLTQQTAKNLFKRRGRTLKEKLRELANGLRLERLYSKEDILEFYANQFYVNGNGRGVAIAARFFFDKDPAQLTLIECAFLAGVVKSPNRYNPWVAGEERATKNRARARERADYVLGRMLEDSHISQSDYDGAMGMDLPFSRGHFRFERSVVLDSVERELERPLFRQLLATYGIEDLGTSGLRVTTTIEQGVQQAALYGLRHQLTDVGTLLEAPDVETFFLPAKALRPVDPDLLRPRTFHVGTLLEVDAEARTARVDLGGTEGLLDAEANTRFATLLKRSDGKNVWAQASRKDVRARLEEFKPHVGDRINVSIRSMDGDVPQLDWEVQPEIQGAVAVIEDGRIRAMVGGSANADFNRAWARRQFGSTWKLVLFEAALQLRWSLLDPLDNRRSVFPYQTTFYYPRPDHKDAPEAVSMAWAATKSENLATIWLLYHLLDPLNSEQVRQVANRVDALPREGEGRKEFVKRIQKAGVVPTSSKLLEGLFERVRGDVAVDLAFDGQDGEAEALESMHFGLGFEAERERVAADRSIDATERAHRKAALSRDLGRQEDLSFDLESAVAGVLAGQRAGDLSEEALARFSARVEPGVEPVISFGDVVPPGFVPITASLWSTLLTSSAAADEALPTEPAEEVAPEPEPLNDAEVDDLFASDDDDSAAGPPEPSATAVAFRAVQLLDPARVRLEGQLTAPTVTKVRAAITAARDALGQEPDLYAADVLPLCRDWRTLVGLRYVQALAERSGVESPIVPVLSIALGSSDVALLEAAQLYQVMLTGRTWRFFPDPLVAPPVDPGVALEVDAGPIKLPSLSLIEEIRLADGTRIFHAAGQSEQLIDAGISGELGSMMRSVVAHGTGRRAEGKVVAQSENEERARELRNLGARVPLFGKTGTTNSYRNSAFVGVVPTLPEGDDRLAWGRGMVVASYVGYDDNREMRRGGIRIAGASGSLPAWIEASRGVVESSQLGDRVSLADAAFAGGGVLPLEWPDGMLPVTVGLVDGLPSDSDEATTTLRKRASEPAFALLPPPKELSP
jgi:penicillin-binding protein 1A